MKVDPEELKEAANDLDAFRHDHSHILGVEPILKKYIDDAAHFAKKRYEEVAEKKA